MIVEARNDRYFTCKLEFPELQDTTKMLAFLASLKNEIPGKRGERPALRYYLGDERMFAIHKSQWEIFIQVVKEHFGYEPENPFNRELFE